MNSFNWQEFKILSEKIVNDNSIINDCLTKECVVRNAVSRTYYSAFHFSMENGQKKGFIRKRNSSDHSGIADFFKPYQNDVFSNLRSLRRKRNMCDYDDKIENIDLIWEDTLILYNDILSEIQTLNW